MITIYSKAQCQFCDMAKSLLKSKDIPFKEIRVDEDAEAMSFIKAEGHRSVPQIYKDGKLFVKGGYQGLKQLNDQELIAA